MKEYLSTDYNLQSSSDINTLCEIPEGAEKFYKCDEYPSCNFFMKNEDGKVFFLYVGGKKWREWVNFEGVRSWFDLVWHRNKQKEYLQKLEDGTYKLVVMSNVVDGRDGLIEVPEGANYFVDNGSKGLFFQGKDSNRCYALDGYDEWYNGSETMEKYLSIVADSSIVWERKKELDIYTATGYELDAIGKSLGADARLPWMSAKEYREQLLRIDATGLKHVGVECVVLGDDEIKATSSDIGFGLADGRVNAFDTQVGGNHYKDLAIQPMEYALKNKLDYAQANVVKYVTRHAAKGGKEDLLKAKHNIDLMIEYYYGEEK